MNKQLYFIYLLECSNGHYYAGYTTDMVRRYQEHLRGSAKCKYTRSFPPRSIAACWQLQAGLSQVLKIEAAIKRLSRAEKYQLCKNPGNLRQILATISPLNILQSCVEVEK